MLAVLLFIPLQAVDAQPRYAAFIHGFTFGDDRPEGGEQVSVVLNDKGARWQASGTIERWKNTGVINGHVLLRHFDRDFYGGNRDWTEDPSRRDMMERFVGRMKSNAPDDAQWVLVGHSQGGIVARALHEHIRQHAPEVDVEGVLTAASPMQGAKPTTVAYGDRPGLENVKPEIDGLIKDLLKAPLAEATSRLLDFILPGGGGAVFDIVANVWDPAAYQAEGVVRILDETLEKKLNAMAVDKKAKSAIGPDGTIINHINNAPNPDHYRALLGAERAPVGARVAAGAFLEEKTVAFSPLAQFGIQVGAFELSGIRNRGLAQFSKLFIGERKVEPGEEPVTVDFFNEVKSTYREAADYYRYRCYATLGLSCVAGDYRKHKRWKQGRRALENFGSTYTEILNAYKMEERVGERTVCRDPYGENTIGGNVVEGAFRAPSASQYVDRELENPDSSYPPDDDDDNSGNECWTESYIYYVTVPNKTDGLLGTITTTWNPAYDNTRANTGPHSILYNDRSSGNQYVQGGTGFNHAEMVYPRRRYSASNDPGISDGAFNRGDLNPPMQDGEEWIDERAFN
jgi:pimeloyl-ACP methyl ester carboxylesterase